MNILKEYIKEIILEETEYVEIESPEKKYTYKELYDFLRFVKHGKNAKKGLGFVASVVGGAALEATISAVQSGGAAVASAFNLSDITEEVASKTLDAFLAKYNLPKGQPLKVLAKFYGINDVKGLEGIAIPNNVSNLIDDKIEAAFIKDVLAGDLKTKAKQSPNEFVDKNWVIDKLKEFTKTYSKTQGTYAEIE